MRPFTHTSSTLMHMLIPSFNVSLQKNMEVFFDYQGHLVQGVHEIVNAGIISETKHVEIMDIVLW